MYCVDHTNYFFLPPFHSWGCSKDVWLNMLKKETRYIHDKHFEVLHSDLEPQMRSILLDWLLEVCCSNTNFLSLYDGKYLDINVFSMCLSGILSIARSHLFGSTLVDDTKMGNNCLIYKSKIRTQPLRPIKSKLNLEFLVFGYCCVPGTILGAENSQDE